MKTKLFSMVVVAALSSGAANAVSLATTFIANTSNNVGLVTTLVTGNNVAATGVGYIYSTSTNLSALNVSSVTTRAAFEALITNDPGVVRSSIAFTSGAVTSTGSVNLGAVGNIVYLWLQTTDASNIGLYKDASVVPSVGAVTINSATMNDLIGTSNYTASGTSGFQLAPAVPEPSAALLGAFGVLGLLRRRRN